MADEQLPEDAADEKRGEAARKPKDVEAEHDASVDDHEMPFLDHLLELRQRLLRSIVAVAVLFVPSFVFRDDIYHFVSAPLTTFLPGGNLAAIDVASPFVMPLKLAAFTSFIAAMPYLLHQLWGFVAPGLYLREKKFALPVLASSILLFYAGMSFAYFVLFPVVFAFFAHAAPEGVTLMTDINRYLTFVLKMFFAFGVAFEIPVATILLVRSGLATAEGIARKRPYVIVGCFIVGMLLTPPDPITQILLAIPVWLLFEVGILLSRSMGRQSKDD